MMNRLDQLLDAGFYADRIHRTPAANAVAGGVPHRR